MKSRAQSSLGAVLGQAHVGGVHSSVWGSSTRQTMVVWFSSELMNFFFAITMETIVNEVTDGKTAISFWKKPWIDQFNRTQTLTHLFLRLCLPNSLGLPVWPCSHTKRFILSERVCIFLWKRTNDTRQGKSALISTAIQRLWETPQ